MLLVLTRRCSSSPPDPHVLQGITQAQVCLVEGWRRQQLLLPLLPLSRSVRAVGYHHGLSLWVLMCAPHLCAPVNKQAWTSGISKSPSPTPSWAARPVPREPIHFLCELHTCLFLSLWPSPLLVQATSSLAHLAWLTLPHSSPQSGTAKRLFLSCLGMRTLGAGAQLCLVLGQLF